MNSGPILTKSTAWPTPGGACSVTGNQLVRVCCRKLENAALDAAAQLLCFGTNHIEGIVPELGYDKPYYFSGLFKKCIGASPKGYRQKNKITG
ncbi:hypothetical protein C7T94_13885 [Pedobacter yulinensis]|uniref:HTH araC/xylS-type domain-containing protein n=1 Tax=Pedobacter yulinensis TaxID=2126353 RepID=A0A2T3HMG3_9SPHI|nr:hypothetical protein C7T94_13885 [Pedobacter yulinensis]